MTLMTLVVPTIMILTPSLPPVWDWVTSPEAAIRSVSADPVAFEGKTIVVRGTVTGLIKLPFYRGYTISDGVAELRVRSAVFPEIGGKVAVLARVESGLIVNRTSCGLHLVELGRH
jgi:hypothetical protein